MGPTSTAGGLRYSLINENRYITFGISRLGRNLVVFHTERGDKTRIISARQMTKNERTIYEEG
ncbi:MAG: BrnT family toxin [Candidatus Scalindua sp. AMX11]|nr:MAG: BrnT family toxin [Candidatus Scalindua sp.]NOG85924.1 BrnT family toxin [Planctomycetota bacterium]RZV91459.1 MAG: BrnT family toxin [Candidatus Scalindua sp. SCAELEC01]TDE66002.1 MAG: BrnT family toxin [Candidatus Scalindua sp. AMX11]